MRTAAMWGVAAITGVTLTACSPEPELQSGTMGSNGQVAHILLRNVYLVAPGDGEYGEGEDGVLRLWLFNQSRQDDLLRQVRSDAAASARIRWDRECDGTFEVANGLPVPAGDPEPDAQAYYVELAGFTRTILAGTTVPVTFTFRHAGEGTIDAMVEASDDGDTGGPPACTSPTSRTS